MSLTRLSGIYIKPNEYMKHVLDLCNLLYVVMYPKTLRKVGQKKQSREDTVCRKKRSENKTKYTGKLCPQNN